VNVVTLVGAGGRMGGRIRRSLVGNADFELRCVEVNETQQQVLREEGFQVMDLEQALAGSQQVIMAVPDRIAGEVAATLVPQLDAGATLVCLDPAAPHSGLIPQRDDITLFVTHPTHPPLYDLLAETDPEARRDYWGGGLARQALVNALAWGEESHYDPAEKLAKEIFRPITRSHRVTLDQMALLEPAMSETVAGSCIDVMRETLDEVIASGVDGQAARDFMLGHIQILIAQLFGELDWELSAGAKEALRDGKQRLMRADWKGVLSEEEVRASTERITGVGG
jgi:D-apionate oxidoisomerase